jgi:putative ABC transport system permease protein
MASSFSQARLVTALNLRTLVTRWQSAAVTVVGIAGVMVVIVGVFSIYEGFRATLELSGAPDVMIILRGGSSDELQSGLALDAVKIVGDVPSVMRDADGPLVSGEVFSSVDLINKATGGMALVPLRGMGPQGPKLRSHLHFISGRMFTPGTNEIVVGQGAAHQFAGIEMGRELKLGANRWNVVGIFSDAGGLAESELWCDLTVLQGTLNYGTAVQSIRARLTSPEAFRAFKDAVTTDPRVNFSVVSERDYLANLSARLRGIIRSAGFAIAILMGLGAIFAALNTMYGAVAARTREIATLRALGFGAFPVVVSVLAEATMLGLVGALIGGAIGYMAFNGVQTSTLNMSSFSQVTFAFRVTGELLQWGLIYALVLALVGGVLPAIRAARLPIASGLREL